MTLICERGAVQEYRDDMTGAGYFSVSQVLAVLDPERFSKVQRDVLNRAQQRGTQVHDLFEQILLARAGLTCQFKLESVPAVLRGYAAGLMEWAEKNSVRPKKIEKASHMPDLPVAGRPDGEVLFGPTSTDIIVELKSGIEERLNRVQVQAYAKMEGYEYAKRLLLLYVDKTGKTKQKWVDPSPHDWAWFCSGVGVLVGRHNIRGGN